VTTAATAATAASPPPAADPDGPLIAVSDLRISFRTDEGLITPVDGVAYTVRRGRTLGIVGESGSGKSVSTRALMKLLPKNAVIDPASRMILDRPEGPVDIAALPADGAEIRRIRGGSIAMIFQEPMASFSPVYTIGNQISEAVRLHRRLHKGIDAGPLAVTGTIGDQISENVRAHGRLTKKQARGIAVEMLDKVGISNAAMRVGQFPHELSGGMRQRAMIAVALSTHPSLLIADEPTTALDVTIQAQILELVRALQDELGMAVIFITHDMGVIAQVADEVAVMYLGTIVERGPTREVIARPAHPYTEGLLRAIPRIDARDRRLSPIPGDIPGPHERPSGCPFRTRCPKAIPGTCDTAVPAERQLAPGHHASCHLV